MGAGAVGVILALAGVQSPVRTALVILFLTVAPTAAIAGLLRGFDPFARIILAVVTTIAVLSIVAVVLLSAGLWSPMAELVGVVVITVGCLTAQVPAVRARVAGWAGPCWRALLRHIPGVRTALAQPQPAEPQPAEPSPAGNGHAAGYVPEVTMTGTAAAEMDTAEAEAAENQPAGPDGTGSAAGTDAAEATTPLPAIHD